MKVKSPSYMTIAFIGIGIVAAFMITATYAYFNSNVSGLPGTVNLESFNSSVAITFTDTSNITLVNAYTGTSITKTFDIQNTGDSGVYYDISFSELTNNFADKDDLVYSLTSNNNGARINETIVPSTDEKLASLVYIPADVTQTYSLTVSFLKTDDNQNDNANKTFSTKISITGSTNVNNLISIYDDNALGNYILNAYTPIHDINTSYNQLPSSDGLYYTNNTIDGVTSYFFRGSNTLNNNVLFGGFCWKIIRTTEKNGIKMIYNGLPSGTSCTNATGVNSYIQAGAFNTNNTYNAYVGYMYGSPGSSTYASEHENTNPSSIKNVLDTWYINNLIDYETYLEDDYYCNDRKPANYTVNNTVFGKLGYSLNNTGYSSMKRNEIGAFVEPSMKCYNIDDIFTVTDNRGNAKLDNPIGLITTDEAIFAGITFGTANANSYLNSGTPYWTMTPAYNGGSYSYNYYINTSKIGKDKVNVATHGIRPVITLKKTVEITNGNGTLTTPYKIKY